MGETMTSEIHSEIYWPLVKELDSLILTYDINANTAFDIYNLPHKLELLNNFFHVVISR